LAIRLLEEIAGSHPSVLSTPEVNVRLIAFGASSLDLEVYFWSSEFRDIDDVKSDIRVSIEQKFRERGIEIPFAQTDVWLRNWEKQ
jgi:small-conductance mechanosensitive channel